MLKEIIRKYPFDFEKFIPLFSERVNYLNAPDCRRVFLFSLLSLSFYLISLSFSSLSSSSSSLPLSLIS
jgi:hypothetical protein